ncbi:putative adenosine A3 receptor [Ixodes scapularis]|uniref:Adenosine A3 receptor, putative n=1 Tax=Ixodes scapularis TaxID=6945 RepID=B7P9L3_IXOSC|nr:adenosine A3 receptor, putative [Ixodes scapularis]|eukprot:XP_002404688.1 adenosine A3 receptor, putative [Ixodes scapularis]
MLPESAADSLNSLGDDPGLPASARLAEALILLIICVSVVAANVLVIATLLYTTREVLDYYLISLAVADLLCGVLIVPLSVYPAIAQDWVYGDFVCRLSGYVAVTLWSVSVYSFMWLSVDRYLAIRKPLRYDTIQTRTRCQCWMLFTWMTSMFMYCPPLFGFSNGHFYRDAYVCMLDLSSILPYTLTLALLVLVPSVLTVIYTYFFIFTTMRKMRKCLSKEEKEYATAIGEHLSNPDHIMSFVIIVLFWLSWLPWICLQIYEKAEGQRLRFHALHFGLLWLGVLDCLWKPLVYITMSPKFRLGVQLLFMSICCRHKSRQHLIV